MYIPTHYRKKFDNDGIPSLSCRDVNFVFFQKSIFVLNKMDFFSIIKFVRRSLVNATISGVVLTYCAALTQRTYCPSEAAATRTDGTDVQIADGRTRIFRIRGRIADLRR